MAASVVSAANIKRYAEIIVERATLRSIIAASDEIAAAAFNTQGRPVAQILDDAKVQFGKLAEARKMGSGRVPMLTLDQLRVQSHSVKWVVKHVVPAESIGLLYGASGTFKSFIGIDLHAHRARPRLAREEDDAGPGHHHRGRGRLGPLAADRRLAPAAPAATGRTRPVYVVPVSVDLGLDAILVRDAAAALDVTPAFVLVDTLSQTFSGEENSAQEVSGYLREIGLQFRSCWQCAVLVVHHTGHSATERPRGSSTLRANVDFMFGVYRDEKEMLATVECAKQKDGEAFDDVTFRVGVHELGTDADGDKVTSLVARHLISAEDVQEAMAAEGKAGRGGSNQLLLSLLQSGQKESELRAVFYAECGIETVDGRRQAFTRARNWAVKNGLIDVAQGVVITLKTGG